MRKLPAHCCHWSPGCKGLALTGMVIRWPDSAFSEGQPVTVTLAEGTVPLYQNEKAYLAPGVHGKAPLTR